MHNRIRLCGVAAALLTPVVASADFATFDDRPEDLAGFTFTNGGITFSDLRQNIPGGDTFSPFSIEFANGTLQGETAFSHPNVLNWGAYTTGNGVMWNRVHEFNMTPSTVSNAISLVFVSYGSQNGNQIAIDLIRNGQVMETATATINGDFQFAQRYTLSSSGTEFDSVRFWSTGPGDNGTVFGVMDDVSMSPVPEPTTLAALGLGALALCRRRKRRG